MYRKVEIELCIPIEEARERLRQGAAGESLSDRQRKDLGLSVNTPCRFCEDGFRVANMAGDRGAGYDWVAVGTFQPTDKGCRIVASWRGTTGGDMPLGALLAVFFGLVAAFSLGALVGPSFLPLVIVAVLAPAAIYVYVRYGLVLRLRALPAFRAFLEIVFTGAVMRMDIRDCNRKEMDEMEAAQP